MARLVPPFTLGWDRLVEKWKLQWKRDIENPKGLQRCNMHLPIPGCWTINKSFKSCVTKNWYIYPQTTFLKEKNNGTVQYLRQIVSIVVFYWPHIYLRLFFPCLVDFSGFSEKSYESTVKHKFRLSNIKTTKRTSFRQVSVTNVMMLFSYNFGKSMTLFRVYLVEFQ